MGMGPSDTLAQLNNCPKSSYVRFLPNNLLVMLELVELGFLSVLCYESVYLDFVTSLYANAFNWKMQNYSFNHHSICKKYFFHHKVITIFRPFAFISY